MSNLRYPHEDGVTSYDDLDCYYPPLTEAQKLELKAKKVEASEMVHAEQSDVSAQQGFPFVVGRVHEEP